ncbi:MAG TPA: alternative ribosome rescue aminoacyl-tRNA hydrolase ArfB, partial [Bacteroidia bacterium]|nr:alternative ribosome rescue aminoacyl-tRNA hydrolase ArfB [Bacteroidia bacterium]
RDTDFSSEWKFTMSRSSGKGGQNVNKLSTKVELHFDYLSSNLLTDEQKDLVAKKLEGFINKEGILKIASQEDRSQLLNKKNCIEKFYGLLEKAFKKKKKRIPTKRSKQSKEKRLKSKKIHSEKKKTRAHMGF